MGSIPGQGTKIPHAMWRGQKERKKEKIEIDLDYLPFVQEGREAARIGICVVYL